ncbi:putative lipoprotein [Pseudomonas reidholzensis]|uniref:Putative lipoprotein n=1 Tax=Pseudomonas reidholzensis TaxID=1785162 RepID=A0A383RUW9_9PSED|nr:hypothetical protein [Pseudomonas reidholzensis]SYX90705.1 putative lipoprotein [Pseudomonas reidholzensis]
MKRFFALSLLALTLTACDKPAENTSQASVAVTQCAKDTDCKGDRICESGQCTSPNAQASLAANPKPVVNLAPTAPSVAYQPLLISGEEAGPFTLDGLHINYQSRAGVMDVMEQVLEEPEYATYVVIEKAYAFGPDKFVLVISTGESGNSCPATTYAVSFDTKTESVDGKASVDGCSENVESLADGNKLIVKKEGAATAVYNGSVQ